MIAPIAIGLYVLRAAMMDVAVLMAQRHAGRPFHAATRVLCAVAWPAVAIYMIAGSIRERR